MLMRGCTVEAISLSMLNENILNTSVSLLSKYDNDHQKVMVQENIFLDVNINGNSIL